MSHAGILEVPFRFLSSLLPSLAPSRLDEAGRVSVETREEEERAWIRRARGGDQDAFRQLVDRYRDQVLETALRIVRSREEAEEVAQDSFVRAWRALEGFREEARFSTWLYRITTRRALDAAARTRKRSDREVGVDPEVLEGAAAPSAAATDLRRLERVLGDLDPTRRAVVTLFYLRDLSIAEVADSLGMPEGTVKTHLHRSRSALRAAWKRLQAREANRGLS